LLLAVAIEAILIKTIARFYEKLATILINMRAAEAA
jgi:hypothetical protein